MVGVSGVVGVVWMGPRFRHLAALRASRQSDLYIVRIYIYIYTLSVYVHVYMYKHV